MICVTDWRLHSILRERAAAPLSDCPAARGDAPGGPRYHQPFGLDFGQRDDYISPSKAT